MKTIFITGTSSGLGQAAVRLFHAKGWKVIATMRNVEKGNTFSDLENVTVLPLDITNPQQIKATAEKAIALGQVDVVVNNAAFGSIGPLEAVTEEQLQKQINTNLLGAIRVIQAFIPHFRENRSGMFVNITSSAGLVTFPFASLYHAAKFGLEGFSEGLTYELTEFGIKVKTVAPGFIHSSFAANAELLSAPAYQETLNRNMQTVSAMMDPTTMGLKPEQAAQVVYDAVTDGTNQVHYLAGDDTKSLYARRLEIGAEAHRNEIASLFLVQ
jgi:NAD(P)-dependent dehydrogenase (short-subunit alcohol dehydrogenase family)